MNIIEKFIFDQFPKMPLPVRVITYLLLLFVFVYLLLIPRFIDGQVIVKDPASGGSIPYRGAEIQMLVEGRNYKFVSNENGLWSVPVISSLPKPVEIQIYHEDLKQWFKVKFDMTQVWRGNFKEIQIRNQQPYVQIAATAAETHTANRSIVSYLFPPAVAAQLVLPSAVPTAALARVDSDAVKARVFETIASTTKKPLDAIKDNSPWNRDGGPTYVQKISIIDQLERAYSMRIYDEHWKSMDNVGQLIDYIQKRIVLQKTLPREIAESTNAPLSDRRPASAPVEKVPDWATIQQSLPVNQRPVFKR